MTMSNGQQQPEPNGSSEHATSTVLALDGWGPVVAEPSPNGSNGIEPELASVEPAIEPIANPQGDADQRAEVRKHIYSTWQHRTPRTAMFAQAIRFVVPVAALAITTFATLKLAVDYRGSLLRQPTIATPSRIDELRRAVALAIDPSLTPAPPRRRWRIDLPAQLEQFKALSFLRR